MNERLKPCPFCGSEAETKSEPFAGFYLKTFAIRCSNPDCIAGVHWVEHIQCLPLIEAWNRRANDGD